MQANEPTGRVFVFNYAHFVFLACVCLSPWLIDGYMRGKADHADLMAKREPAKEEARAARENVISQKRLSGLAMDRVSLGCIPIVDKNTQQPVWMSEADQVAVVRGTAQPLIVGTTICNVFGETATVGANGTVETIARVPTEDRQDYDELFKKLGR